MYVTKRLLIGGLLLLAGSSYGQVISLEKILAEIEASNISLKSYDAKIKSQEAKVEGAGAWMAPMIGAGTFMTPYPGKEVMDDGSKGSFMISAEQDIPNPAKIKAKREYLKTQSETYMYLKNSRMNELRATARQLYFELLVAYRKNRYQQENRQIMQTMKKLAEIRYPYNQGSLSQIFKAEGRLSEADNMLLMTESTIRARKIALNALMNRNPSGELEIDTAFKVSFNPEASLDTAYLAGSRSDLQHMQHDVHAMEANIRQMRQEAKPDFRIRFDHMSSYSPMMPGQFTLMGMLSVPIAPWASKMYKSEIKSMNFEIQAMQQQKQNMQNEMLGMIKSMENELGGMQKQLGNYENRILPALNKNMQTSLLSYQENKGDLNQVIDAWETVNMAQMNYLDQLQKYYQMIVEYEKNIER